MRNNSTGFGSRPAVTIRLGRMPSQAPCLCAWGVRLSLPLRPRDRIRGIPGRRCLRPGGWLLVGGWPLLSCRLLLLWRLPQDGRAAESAPAADSVSIVRLLTGTSTDSPQERPDGFAGRLATTADLYCKTLPAFVPVLRPGERRVPQGTSARTEPCWSGTSPYGVGAVAAVRRGYGGYAPRPSEDRRQLSGPHERDPTGRGGRAVARAAPISPSMQLTSR